MTNVLIIVYLFIGTIFGGMLLAFIIARDEQPTVRKYLFFVSVVALAVLFWPIMLGYGMGKRMISNNRNGSDNDKQE